MRILVIFMFGVVLTGCGTRSGAEKWYLNHPEKLKNAIQACPKQRPSQLDCTSIIDLQFVINNIAPSLRENPQMFGKKILQMQGSIARLKSALTHQDSSGDVKIQEKIKAMEKQLQLHLVAVRLYESPEG